LRGYYTPENFSLSLGVFVVRPKHPDITTEAQRHEDEGEIVSPGLPTENSEEPFLFISDERDRRPELGHHFDALSSKSQTVYICAYIHRFMASKTISIRDDIYKMLKDAKKEEESFSDVIERLLKKDKVDLSEYFGTLKDDPLLDRLEADSKRIREMARSRV